METGSYVVGRSRLECFKRIAAWMYVRILKHCGVVWCKPEVTTVPSTLCTWQRLALEYGSPLMVRQ